MKFSFVLSFVIIVTLASGVSAQQAKTVGVFPCSKEGTPGRPTLKQRQIKTEENSPAEQNDAVAVNAEPCDNASPKSNDVQIRFEGLTTLAETDLLKYLREGRVNLSVELVTDSVALTKAGAAIKNLLSEYGHRHARVSSRLEQADKEQPVLIFVINEGPRFSISQIQFEGNRVFSGQVLAAGLRADLARFDKDGRNVYRPEVFKYGLYLLADFARSQGYLRATFSEPKVEEVGDGVIITISADEGVLYRLGSIEMEGAYHVNEQDIRKMIDIRAGDIVNGEKISKALYEDLKVIYGEKGFIQYTAEIQPEFHISPGATEGIVDFHITVDEGRRFRVRKISFKGDVPENELRQLLTLREGDVYNQKLFEESVAKMNDTGWFNWVDKDKDVDYRTNEEEDLLDLVVRVTRRSPM